MSPVRSKPKSALARLKQIDRLLLKISARLAPLESEDALHIPRTGPFPRGRSPTAVGPGCEPSCPTCVLIWKHYRRRSGLAEPQRAALLENVQSRLRSDKALVDSRGKITMENYQRVKRVARSRKELASLLGVTRQGLNKWEKKNNLWKDGRNSIKKY